MLCNPSNLKEIKWQLMDFIVNKSYTSKTTIKINSRNTLITKTQDRLTFCPFLVSDDGKRWSHPSLVSAIPQSLTPSSHRPWQQSVLKWKQHSLFSWLVWSQFIHLIFMTCLKAVFDEGLWIKESLKKDLSCRHSHLIKTQNNNWNDIHATLLAGK